MRLHPHAEAHKRISALNRRRENSAFGAHEQGFSAFIPGEVLREGFYDETREELLAGTMARCLRDAAALEAKK